MRINAYNVDAVILYGVRMVEHDCLIHREKVSRHEEFFLRTRSGQHLGRRSIRLNGPCTIPEAVVDCLCDAGMIGTVDEAGTIFDLTPKGRAAFSSSRI